MPLPCCALRTLPSPWLKSCKLAAQHMLFLQSGNGSGLNATCVLAYTVFSNDVKNREVSAVLDMGGQSTDCVCALKPASMCAVTNLTADDILLTGGTVTNITHVSNSYDYLVWVRADPGVASLAIAVTPGEVPQLTVLDCGCCYA